jgi:hypothetical protein
MEDKLILKITIYTIGTTWVKYILIPLHHEIGDLELLEWHVNLRKIHKVNTQYQTNTNTYLF